MGKDSFVSHCICRRAWSHLCLCHRHKWVEVIHLRIITARHSNTDVYSAVAAAAYAAAASNAVNLVNNEALSDGTINALDITQISDQWNNY